MKIVSTREQRGFKGSGCLGVTVTLIMALSLAFTLSLCSRVRSEPDVTPNPKYQRYDRSIDPPCSPRRRDCP